MPRDLHQLLEDTAPQPTRPVDAAGIVRRARRQRVAGRGALSAIAVMVVLAAVAATIGLTGGTARDPDGDVQLAPPPGPPRVWSPDATLDATTNTTLLFDNGQDGVWGVDLDTGVGAVRYTLEGQRAGDQPYRLWRTGKALVVGWGNINAVSLETGETTRVGDATIFVPAAEEGHVWLIDYPGGRIGQGTPTYRLVRISGEVALEARGPASERSSASIGVRGGLALETPQGVAIWDARSRDIVATWGEANAYVADAVDRTIAWCEDDCTRFHVSDLDGRDLVFAPPPGHDVFDARSARLSPDGRLVAGVAGSAGPVGPDSFGTVVILDTVTGEVRRITRPLLPRPDYLAWSQDGDQLFFSASSYGAGETNVGRYGRDDGHVDLATMPLGGGVSFVPLSDEEAATLLGDAPTFDVDSPEEDGADR